MSNKSSTQALIEVITSMAIGLDAEDIADTAQGVIEWGCTSRQGLIEAAEDMGYDDTESKALADVLFPN